MKNLQSVLTYSRGFAIQRAVSLEKSSSDSTKTRRNILSATAMIARKGNLMKPTPIQNFRNRLTEGLLSQNPPEAAKAEGPELNEETAPTSNGAEHSSRLKKFSLKLEGGVGWKNFNNGEGMDHFGWTARLSAGFFAPVGARTKIGARAFVELQQFNKTIVPGFRSSAFITAGGVETEIAIAAHPRWFSVHPTMGFGVVHYRAKSDDFGFVGAQYGGHILLNPMNDAGFRAEIGLGLCTLGGTLCLTPRFQGDLGINPKVMRPPIAGPEVGLNVFGVNIGASIDLLQLITEVRTNRRQRKEDISLRQEKRRGGDISEAASPLATDGPTPAPTEDASHSAGISEPTPIFDHESVFEKQPINYDEVYDMEGLIQAVEKLESNQVLFVAFTADWCPACEELKKSFDAIAGDLKRENGAALNIVWAEGRNGSEQDWVNLGVTAFPTFALIDSNGGMRILEVATE